MATDKKLSLGSWSEGSTRTADILEAVFDMASDVGYESDRLEEAVHALEALTDDDHTCDADVCAGDYADECVSDMIEALDEYAPIYCYVGMAEGDGANFGVWPAHDSIQDAIRNAHTLADGRLLNITDMVIIDISDHGNVEVYAIERGASLLSLV